MAVTRKNIVPLNEEEQKFATQHHNIIYDYLHKRKLPIEEYYDLACIGYVHAVADYCRRFELHKYAFTTIAWYGMRAYIGNYQDHIRRKSAELVSIDAEITDSGGNLADVLGEVPPPISTGRVLGRCKKDSGFRRIQPVQDAGYGLCRRPDGLNRKKLQQAEKANPGETLETKLHRCNLRCRNTQWYGYSG